MPPVVPIASPTDIRPPYVGAFTMRVLSKVTLGHAHFTSQAANERRHKTAAPARTQLMMPLCARVTELNERIDHVLHGARESGREHIWNESD